MPHIFEPDVIAAILRHMNDDHRDDNLLITRAFVDREISSAEMVRFDGDGGTWLVATAATSPAEATIAWPGGSISERPAVRREIVALYDEACERLGVEPRPHS
jgi:hypothetical protein